MNSDLQIRLAAFDWLPEQVKAQRGDVLPRTLLNENGQFGFSYEVNETHLGGKESNKHKFKQLKAGRRTIGKTVILGTRERKRKVKAMPVSSTSKTALQGALQSHVAHGAEILTDNHGAYIDLQGYCHRSVNHSAKEFVNDMAQVNGSESVWAVLKRGYNGVYHNWSRQHCCQYVNEFAFRLNEGNVEMDIQNRLDVLFDVMSGKTITYKELTK